MISYQIHISLKKNIEIHIGQLGIFKFPRGLYIYSGEDLPVEDPLTKDEVKEMLALAEKTGDKSKYISIADMIDNGQIDRTNYSASFAKLERLVKEKSNEKSKS